MNYLEVWNITLYTFQEVVSLCVSLFYMLFYDRERQENVITSSLSLN